MLSLAILAFAGMKFGDSVPRTEPSTLIVRENKVCIAIDLQGERTFATLDFCAPRSKMVTDLPRGEKEIELSFVGLRNLKGPRLKVVPMQIEQAGMAPYKLILGRDVLDHVELWFNPLCARYFAREYSPDTEKLFTSQSSKSRSLIRENLQGHEGASASVDELRFWPEVLSDGGLKSISGFAVLARASDRERYGIADPRFNCQVVSTRLKRMLGESGVSSLHVTMLALHGILIYGDTSSNRWWIRRELVKNDWADSQAVDYLEITRIGELDLSGMSKEYSVGPQAVWSTKSIIDKLRASSSIELSCRGSRRVVPMTSIRKVKDKPLTGLAPMDLFSTD